MFKSYKNSANVQNICPSQHSNELKARLKLFQQRFDRSHVAAPAGYSSMPWRLRLQARVFLNPLRISLSLLPLFACYCILPLARDKRRRNAGFSYT